MSDDVVIVDAGLGNLRSVERATRRAASEAGRTLRLQQSADPDVVRRASRLVVPGQGGYGALVEAYADGLGEAVREQLTRGTPYFGICLGLQALFEASDEAPGAGLGWFQGRVARLPAGPSMKVPHVGWNQIQVTEPHPLLAGLDAEWFYFVHSYHAVPADPRVVVATASYGEQAITAAVSQDHVFATQFHPEKSQAAGILLLRAFLTL